MSNVISFLQALGENGPMKDDAFVAAVADLDLDPAMRAALLARDQAAINHLLGGRSNVFSLLVPAEDDEKNDDDRKGDEEEQQEQIRIA